MTPEAGFDFDIDRAADLSWVALGNPDPNILSWSIIYDMKRGPQFVPTSQIEFRVMPELSKHKGRTLVDVVGQGVAARAIIAAADQGKIDRYINPKHPLYHSPGDLTRLLPKSQ